MSADNGEVGILGGSFGQGTVPKGEDKVSFGRIENIGCCSILFVVPHMSNLVLTFFEFTTFRLILVNPLVNQSHGKQPPSVKLPGLDFSSGSGKKLIGY